MSTIHKVMMIYMENALKIENRSEICRCFMKYYVGLTMCFKIELQKNSKSKSTRYSIKAKVCLN